MRDKVSPVFCLALALRFCSHRHVFNHVTALMRDLDYWLEIQLSSLLVKN
ncbi:hypothetical protein MHIR_DE00207 [Candidatus Doolittlea endobia]|uniref:Uncharacterized protein n=1 Tax=Candidatus Doolittlea endobia TaxID=1778262 RepID=A0A143WS22_9ENTR|nr:hypothetical protein MHIR_DE00207 [Candidatus Doolittlea endobia]